MGRLSVYFLHRPLTTPRCPTRGWPRMRRLFAERDRLWSCFHSPDFQSSTQKRRARPAAHIQLHGTCHCGSENGNIEETEAFIKALEGLKVRGTPRGEVWFDDYHQLVFDIHILVLEKVAGEYEYKAIETIPHAGQFWELSPEEFMSTMPPFGTLKGTWAKK